MLAKKTSDKSAQAVAGSSIRQLCGKRILITRMLEQAGALAQPLAALGALPVVCPTIEIVPPESYAELDAALETLSGFDYLILTSANAVNAFFNRLEQLGLAHESLAKVSIVAVGPNTATAIAGRGVTADLMPQDYRAEGIVDLMKDLVVGKRLLYPKAALARDLIPTRLCAAGAEVITVEAYGSAPPAEASQELARALAEGLDLLTFTASSTVQNFVDLLDAKHLAQARRIPAASIGPLTTETARKLGFRVVAEPAASTLEAMVEAIGRYFVNSNPASDES